MAHSQFDLIIIRQGRGRDLQMPSKVRLCPEVFYWKFYFVLKLIGEPLIGQSSGEIVSLKIGTHNFCEPYREKFV